MPMVAFPVTIGAGRTGSVTLNPADIPGLGTASLQDYGAAAGNLVQLDGTAHISVALLPIGLVRALASSVADLWAP